jgi:hypothetical protein
MAEAESEAVKPAAEKGTSSSKAVITLLREELHKLEYSYGRQVRLHPPEKSLGKVVLTQGVRDRLAYLEKQKQSLETDLRNVGSDRNALKDIRTQDEIGELLDTFEEFNEVISRKVFKLSELRRSNNTMLQLLTKLSMELDERRAAILDESSRAEAQKGRLEEKMHAAQAALNREKFENMNLIREVNSESTLRKVLFGILQKQNKEYKDFMDKLSTEATSGCNGFRAYKALKSKIEGMVADANRKYEHLMMTIADLYRMADEKMEVQKYFIKIKEHRVDTASEDRRKRERAKFENQLKDISDRYKFLEKGHDRLLRVCKSCHDLQEVASSYNALDESNRELVTEIMSLDDEVMELSKINHKLVEKMDNDYDDFPGVKVMAEQQSLGQLCVLLETAETELVQKEAFEVLAKHSLDIFIPALKDAFDILGTESEPLTVFLGAKKGLTYQNIDLCVNLMEHRISELLFEKQYYETWGEMKEGETNPRLPEQNYGSPAATGGIVSPDVHLTANSTDIGEELEQILHQLDRLAPVLPADIWPEAKEKVWKQNVRKREAEESAARFARLKIRPSAKAVPSSEKASGSTAVPEKSKSTRFDRSTKPSKSKESLPDKTHCRSEFKEVMVKLTAVLCHKI